MANIEAALRLAIPALQLGLVRSHRRKEIAMDSDVPQYVRDAAKHLTEHFASKGVRAWSCGGVQSGYQPRPDSTDARVVELSLQGLVWALKARDPVPASILQAAEGTLEHLGACCRNGRVVCIKLASGQTLRVSLE